MNEKMENWVVQCFSDLRTRIIDLVRPPTSLLPVHMLCLHTRVKIAVLCICCASTTWQTTAKIAVLCICCASTTWQTTVKIAVLCICCASTTWQTTAKIAVLCICGASTAWQTIVNTAGLSPSDSRLLHFSLFSLQCQCLQYLEPPFAVVQDSMSGQFIGVSHSTCWDAFI